MQVSVKWLKDYIDFQESGVELADKLTMAGIPVENVIDTGAALDKVVTGRIEKLEPHTNSDHLQICTMNVGGKEPLIIVTGAPNVAQGQVVPVAMIGANLPNGMKISKGKLRGVTSWGMLCSAGELKLDLENLPEEQRTGIYILPEDTPVGLPIKDVLGINDIILEFELTANRGDCFSVIGLVREIAALTGNVPHYPEIFIKEDGENLIRDFSIAIEAEDLCRRFSGRILTDVKVGPSPAWMVDRLEAAGIRSVNNLVDTTNFVMLEQGNPMHAYDYDTLAGRKLVARRAKAGEVIHTLDDTKKEATEDMLVIADAEKVAGLAGVMGGLETEITEKTTTVVLECADFYGPSIRRTARKFGIHSEASGRFERGVDRTNTLRALDRTCQLLQEMGACKVAPGYIDVYPVEAEKKVVSFTPAAINRHLGTGLSGAEMVDFLTSVGFKVLNPATDEYTAVQVEVPTWRNDVSFMSDLAEEVARLYGFHNIPAKLPFGECMEGAQTKTQILVDKMKKSMVAQGLCETISFALSNQESLNKLNIPASSELRKAVPIMNPLSDEYPLVRTTLLSSVMDNVQRNIARKNEDLGIFEIGFVFAPKALPVTELPTETLKMAGAITGRRHPVAWNQGSEAVDFYDVKGLMENLFDELHITRFTVEREDNPSMHPGKTAAFKKGRDVLAVFGELHPQVMANYGLTKPVYVFEIDVATVMKYLPKELKNKSLPKYPASNRDLAMLVDSTVPVAELEKLISKTAGNMLICITLFDVYTGKQIEAGKRSLAFALTFQSNDRTLTDVEIDEIMQKVVAKLEAQYNAILRS